MMLNQMGPALEILTWQAARENVARVNKELVAIIDQFDPPSDYKLIKARYNFGQHILKQGVLHLPNPEGQLLPISDPAISHQVREQLEYFITMPPGIVLNNSIELYLKDVAEKERIIPFSFMRTGKIFALWHTLDLFDSAHRARIWNITAGARSLIMLPKIYDSYNFAKIEDAFLLKTARVPKTLSEQWKLFVRLANHPEFTQYWSAELIYFGSKWFHKQDNVNWKLLDHYFLKNGWRATAFLRNQTVFDFEFSKALFRKNLMTSTYVVDTVKHLYHIGVGAYPAFIVAYNDEAAPVSTFQQIFNDVYGLKYAPVMVHPGRYSETDTKLPGYYSLQTPTSLSFSPKAARMTHLEDLLHISRVVTGVTDYILGNRKEIGDTPLYRWAENTQYDFCHTASQQPGFISNTHTLVEGDNALKCVVDKFNKPFSERNNVLRCSIRIATKQDGDVGE